MTSATHQARPGGAHAAGEIVVDNVAKSYGAGAFTKDVVRDCSFTVERNKLTVMIGPSGCGEPSPGVRSERGMEDAWEDGGAEANGLRKIRRMRGGRGPSRGTAFEFGVWVPALDDSGGVDG